MNKVSPNSATELKAAQFERMITKTFRSLGWGVKHQAEHRVDLLLSHAHHIYIAQVTNAEPRRDRAIPLLAQAILQVRAAARSAGQPVLPLAIIASERIPDALASDLHDFAVHYAPEVAVGVVDLEGFRSFRGSGLEGLSAPRSRAIAPIDLHRVRAPQLFSDLNQWMLKVLLAPAIPEPYLNAPRKEYRNASQLAEGAGVTVMSAFRLVRSLKDEGFLDGSSGMLKLVRIPELLRRLQAASLLPVRDLPARWIIAEAREQLEDALQSYHGQLPAKSRTASRSRKQSRPWPRACLGLFAAADTLGVGFVKGVPPTIYLEKADSDAIRKLGLSPELSSEPPDVLLRIPRCPEAIFRASVIRNGVPVSDALQVWLDASNHPARGKQQAKQLQHGILASLFSGEA